MNKPFFCYSCPLKDFFVSNGLRFVAAATNQTTGKKYWLFDGGEKLNELLKQWRLNK